MSSDQLRDLLQEYVKSLGDEIVSNFGEISAEKVETLERLARVVEIRNKTKPPPVRKRWPVITILGISLLLVTFLLAIRIPKTEIELNLVTTEMRFELSKPVILADAMVLSALGASELREIQLPRAQSLDGQRIAAKTVSTPTETGTALRLSVVEDVASKGSITLTALLLPAGARVWISRTEVPDQYRMSLEIPEKSQLNVQVSVNGTLSVAGLGGPAEQIVYSVPRAIQMQATSNQVTLDLTLSEGTQVSFAPHLPAKDIAFVRIDQFMDTTSTYVRRVSTVLSGALYFAELDNRKYPLRRGEGLQFERSSGQIRILTMADDQLTLEFHGDVRGMTTGWEDNRQTLMPTWLEWLGARHSLTLFWGTGLYLFGLVLGVWRWWKKAG